MVVVSVTEASGAPIFCTMNTRHTLDAATIRELAVRADVDPRTISKVMDGQPARGMAGRRARAALIAGGFLEPSKASGQPGGNGGGDG